MSSFITAFFDRIFDKIDRKMFKKQKNREFFKKKLFNDLFFFKKYQKNGIFFNFPSPENSNDIQKRKKMRPPNTTQSLLTHVKRIRSKAINTKKLVRGSYLLPLLFYLKHMCFTYFYYNKNFVYLQKLKFFCLFISSNMDYIKV